MPNRIPQNRKEFFEFIINKDKYYLDIEYNHKTRINYINLFMIIKFYTNNEEFLLDNIYINSSEIELHDYENFSINLFHKIDIKKIKKIKLYEFIELVEDIKENDYEYIKSLKYYGFRLVFNKNSIIWKDFKYPCYPWNKKQLKIYIKKEFDIKKWLFYRNKMIYKELINKIKKGRVYRNEL